MVQDRDIISVIRTFRELAKIFNDTEHRAASCEAEHFVNTEFNMAVRGVSMSEALKWDRSCVPVSYDADAQPVSEGDAIKISSRYLVQDK